MKAAHTPGPWKVGPTFDNDGVPEIVIERLTPAGNLVIAVALGGLKGQEANARLIAAAPELLAVVQELEESAAYWSEYDVPLGIVDRLRAAIAISTVGAK